MVPRGEAVCNGIDILPYEALDRLGLLNHRSAPPAAMGVNQIYPVDTVQLTLID